VKTKSATGIPLAEEAEHYAEFYRQMRLIRRFEDAVERLFLKGEVHGTTHLYSGQEASAVGICSALSDADVVAGTYRGHGHALALGVQPQQLMDELLGRKSGVCGGRAGSMNVIDLEHGLLGCFGIVGGSIAAATGVATAFKLRREPRVAVAFFGDGATNQAYFFECLNLAKVERLPVVFVCENNLYMEFTPIENATAGEISERPRAMGIETEVVDGNDVLAVRRAAENAVESCRGGNGPSFIMTMTYRFVGHSRSDPGRYRKPGELDAWKARDPLLLARARLEGNGVAGTEIDDIDAAVEAEIEAVVARALAAEWPQPTLAAEFKDADDLG
jgi:acetoin:2,6-dichlorophenolindophenol oxidoreductase subunit alpha